MFAFAFKNAQRAAELEEGAAKLFSLAIKEVTGGEYCHVECWLSGPSARAVCSAAREPDGITTQTLDLSDRGLWSVIEIPSNALLDLSAYWFARGSNGKKYDAEGIVGIGTGSAVHEESQRFCSEYAAEMAREVFDLPLFRTACSGSKRWMFAPSGPAHRFDNGEIRYGLRDVLIEAGGLKEWN
jgi:hypothetical protein